MSEENRKLFHSYLRRESHPFIELAEEIKDRYCEIFNKYCKRENQKKANYLSLDSVDTESVTYTGQETWRYGGFENHILEIPSVFFEDTDKAFIDFENKLKKEEVNRKNSIEQLKEHRAKLEFDRLKKSHPHLFMEDK